MRLTELDKTILLAFLVFTKGSLDTYVKSEELESKFSIRKRKLVRISLKRLTERKLLIRHEREDKYKFSKEGLKNASLLLREGAKLWKF